MPSDCSSANRPWKEVDDRLKLLEILDSLERKGASALYRGAWSHLEEDEHDAFLALQESMNSSNIDFAHRLLQEQRRTSQLITQLSQSFHGVIEEYQFQLLRRIFRRGLDLLPDELLADICEILCEDPTAQWQTRVDYYAALNNFQLVCRRFRGVALGRSRLWSAVSDDMTPERIEMQVKRCVDLGMSFRIEHSVFARNHRCKCQEWRAIKRHSHRWVRAELYVFCTPPQSGHVCDIQLQGLNLPSLTAVKLRLENSLRARSITSTWAMPRVESVVCTAWAVSEFPITHPLKRLELLLNGVINLVDTLQFLSSRLTISLQVLSLDFAFTSLGGSGNDGALSIVTLDHVRRVTVAIGRHDNVAAFRFLRCLKLPAIERIALRIHESATAEPAFLEWWRNLRHSGLKHISLTVFDACNLDGTSQGDLRNQLHQSLGSSFKHARIGLTADIKVIVEFDSTKEHDDVFM